MIPTKTLVTFVRCGRTYEVDHIGFADPNGHAQFVVFCEGQVCGQFSVKPPHDADNTVRFELPSDADLIEFAEDAVAAAQRATRRAEAAAVSTTVMPGDTLATSLTRDLQAAAANVIADALERHARKHRPSPILPPLRWSAPTDHVGRAVAVVGTAPEGRDSATVTAFLLEWAGALDLRPAELGLPGTRHFVGVVDDLPVRIWGVVDRDRFERHCATTELAFAEIASHPPTPDS